jgi:hypothetical protein
LLAARDKEHSEEVAKLKRKHQVDLEVRSAADKRRITGLLSKKDKLQMEVLELNCSRMTIPVSGIEDDVSVAKAEEALLVKKGGRVRMPANYGGNLYVLLPRNCYIGLTL